MIWKKIVKLQFLMINIDLAEEVLVTDSTTALKVAMI